MGEYSKRIGEVGEEIVKEVLDLIGWSNPRRNFDIPSVYPEKHKKNTHGIDGFFHYKSQMISQTIENVIYSVKFSNTNKYPNDPVKTFKEYYLDLAIVIESFKRSDVRTETINQHQKIKGSFERGIIFWINNFETDNPDLYKKLFKIESPVKDISHDGIFLVDNLRMEFLFDSMNFVKLKFPGATVEFLYFSTGLNEDDTEARTGTIMPVQYLTSSILPLKVETNNEVTFVMFTREEFKKDVLTKLMGLAKNLTSNFSNNVWICFPDYNTVNHAQDVDSIKQVFNTSSPANTSFTKQISIQNFASPLRG